MNNMFSFVHNLWVSRQFVYLEVMLFAFAVNLPFGYLRAGQLKMSKKWFLYVHLPIPLIVIFRIYSGLTYKVIPLLVISSVGGQILGGRLRNKTKSNQKEISP